MRKGNRIEGVATASETLVADAYLVALGSYSPLLLRPIGIRIPVYPVKGYSITVPIVDASGAPGSTVMDETHKTRRQTLTHVVSDLFPEGGDVAGAEFWCGLRPMTPDGTPVIGPTPIANLYLATGHGTWAGRWPRAPPGSSPTSCPAVAPASTWRV